MGCLSWLHYNLNEFCAKHAALRRKGKDRLGRNQDNVSEWGNISVHGLLFQWTSTIKMQLRERPFNLKGEVGVWFFVSFRNFFRTTQELEYLFFCRARREIFCQNLTLGYMTKTLNQNIFFSSTKIRIFFSAILGIRIFF